ncbi:MAG TPA: cytochrome c biogenesis protein DipZ [Candidatus Saccharimonadales bacterium]|nr:cytochrome c biogenesis protein DipZ [Candidatus Saccharimonadales bacterium]
MIILLLFAFLAGIVTILSPCILPILPIVLSGTVGGDKKRPYGIIVGFILSFTFFTLFLATIVRLTGIPTDALRIIAAIILLAFGLSLLIPAFQSRMEILFSKLSVYGPKANPHAGFWGGFIIGLTIGIVWTPCVGPILASVIALAATSQVSTATFLITLTYSIGTAIPMFLIMYGGRNLLKKASFLTEHTTAIQKAFGILMILFAIAIFTNVDQKIEAYLAATPYGADLTQLESNSTVTQQLNSLKGNHEQNSSINQSDLFNTNTQAPDFVGITKWLNTDKPLAMKDLKGKVVLVDFWTYTCINCIRTLPHVTSWYDKYHNQGFVVVGVHTPEFEFEHETVNVENAIKQYNIHYPVAQDNDYATWNNYNNQYWPAEYLIDANGIIRREDFGEGEYDQMELAIQTLLKQSGHKVTDKIDALPDTTPHDQISPETYLGSERMQYYYPSSTLSNGTGNYMLSDSPPQDTFSLGGQWTINTGNAMAGKNATLTYNFTASNVYLVLNPASTKQASKVKVFLDGKLVDSSNEGTDVKDGVLDVQTDRLYNLINLHGKTENHTLKLEFNTPGTQGFAFTFG